MAKLTTNGKRVLCFYYVNWKGRSSKRQVVDPEIWYGTSEYHSGDQWFIHAFDLEKQAWRDYAMKDITLIEDE